MKICPYLGLLQDPKTPAIFPSERNYCYRVDPGQAVLDTHQQEYCLTQAHQSCPVFLDQAASNSDFLYSQRYLAHNSGSLKPFVLAFFLLLGLALAAWYYRDVLFGGLTPAQPVLSSPVAAPLPEQSSPDIPDSVPLATALATSTATPPPTDTPRPPTETASVTPPPGLGMPIGSNPALVIHRVASGESLTIISALYGTSETAIRAVNLMLPIPLWENWLVVVPFRTDDIGDLPLFEAYQVNVEGLTVAGLARQLAVDAALLAKYNNLEEDGFFANGQWVLVPHTR